MTAAKCSPIPHVTCVPLDAGARLTVRAYSGGEASLEFSASALTVLADLNRVQTAELVAALAPKTADLVETLELLIEAADALMPSKLVDAPEAVASCAECISRIADARALLAGR